MEEWLKTYVQRMEEVFGSRIVFAGIQGSYGRGEATEKSDIDVVLILDELDYIDLKIYDNAISSLSHRDKICGFVSGKKELENWEKSDLFQFYHDTTPLLGSLEWMEEIIKEEDILQAVHLGACNIYHMCVHNAVHEKSSEALRAMYKSAVFVLQAKYFCEKQIYIKTKAELLTRLEGSDQKILESAAGGDFNGNFDQLSEMLINWTGKIIKHTFFTKAT